MSLSFSYMLKHLFCCKMFSNSRCFKVILAVLLLATVGLLVVYLNIIRESQLRKSKAQVLLNKALGNSKDAHRNNFDLLGGNRESQIMQKIVIGENDELKNKTMALVHHNKEPLVLNDDENASPKVIGILYENINKTKTEVLQKMSNQLKLNKKFIKVKMETKSKDNEDESDIESDNESDKEEND